jgi:tRNA G18 (ribose-2'-O)-methylase SpoU
VTKTQQKQHRKQKKPTNTRQSDELLRTQTNLFLALLQDRQWQLEILLSFKDIKAPPESSKLKHNSFELNTISSSIFHKDTEQTMK